ncbi:hypothetical protein E4U41_002156 [Claviceps citrina]|nr:hypothetical protein E4U41_002156 [Claviceps citrina]
MTFATSSVGRSPDRDGDLDDGALGSNRGVSSQGDGGTATVTPNNTMEVLSDAAFRASVPERSPNGSHSGMVGEDGMGDDASTVPISARAYQLEMLDQSLKQNTIVVMDTGSGKTHVAVLRIKAELERCGPDQIVWFLAPTVALCSQQFDVIRLQVAAVPMKLLTGQENVDTWSPAIWKTILRDVRIVVSTYQVLLDALCHSFVKMDRISLIVFDEAHNCSGKHPGSKIMTDFYHRRKESGLPVPSILGITATPSMTEDIENINILEATLDGKCITPTLHRKELLQCVKRPRIRRVLYNAPGEAVSTTLMRRLQHEFQSLDITQDPCILQLQKDPTERNGRALAKAIEKYDTFVQNQIRGLRNRSVEIAEQLGPWAADLYIWKAASSFLERVNEDEGNIFDNWLDSEKKYLAEFLRRVSPQQPPPMPRNEDDVSEKASALIKELAIMDGPVVCIIFAKERATVSLLCDLLRACPRIAEKHRIGSIVGSSTQQGRRNVLYEPIGESGQTALQDFRTGKTNILIATSVLEEGIDVPACNTVICFDHPSTPKAFVQRRGRARMKDSTLLLLSERSSSVIGKWEALEKDMKAVYRDTEREIHQLRKLEESEATCPRYFEVQSTGARLDFDNAKSHLERFCSTGSTREFVDNRPEYIIHGHFETTPPTLSASVLLPPSVPAGLRVVEGQLRWLSQKNATKEAAFQAYRALYDAGLINEHLLPFKDEPVPEAEKRAAEVEVEPLLNPWFAIAKAWKQADQVWSYSLTCHDIEHSGETKFDIILPCKLDQWRPIEAYIGIGDSCRLQCDSQQCLSAAEASSLPDHTSSLLSSHFAYRWTVEESRHVIKIYARDIDSTLKDPSYRAFDASDETMTGGNYLIRDATYAPYQYLGLVPHKPPAEQVQDVPAEYETAPKDIPYLIVKKWTRRADFLHPLTFCDVPSPTTTKPYPRVLPLPYVQVDALPLKYARLGMLIPSVIHEIEVMLITKELSDTLLRRLSITELGLVREAISSGGAAEPVNYERLEFVGDSVLKYLSTIQVLAMHPDWPESFLTFCKDRIVSNSRLSRAAIETRLARFILTKSFTGQKWRPMYLANYDPGLAAAEPPRKMSTKTLADVMEALIGASYVDGGIAKAQACISLFVNEVPWRDVAENRNVFYARARDQVVLSPELQQLEELVGYRFTKRSLLLEAMTHPSCYFSHETRSYQQLEFLGDAVLDYIIVRRLYAVTPPLDHFRMHILKTAMVNGDFLAFLCLNYRKPRTETVVTADLQVIEKEATPLALWNFMRHSSEPIGVEQAAVRKRFEALRTDVLAALAGGDHYPWALLARLQAKKFYSDIVESVLGAIWVDSGSVEECEAFLERLGLLSYLDRLVRDGVEARHPKELIGMYAVTQTVTYSIGLHGPEGGEQRYTCRVSVGSDVVAEVFDGLTKEEVKTKAAYEAVRAMDREKQGRMQLQGEGVASTMDQCLED